MSKLRDAKGRFKKGHHKVPKHHSHHKHHRRNPSVLGAARVGAGFKAMRIGRVARILVVR